MPARQSNPNNRTPSRRNRTPRASRPVVIARRELLATLPVGTNAFLGTVGLVHPYALHDARPIATMYSEFRFTRFLVSIIPRGQSAANGLSWSCWQFNITNTRPADLGQAASLVGFRSRPLHLGQMVNRAPLRLSRSPWFEIAEPEATLAISEAQALLHVGHAFADVGWDTADVYVDYVLHLRGQRDVRPSGLPITQLLSDLSSPLSLSEQVSEEE